MIFNITVVKIFIPNTHPITRYHCYKRREKQNLDYTTVLKDQLSLHLYMNH